MRMFLLILLVVCGFCQNISRPWERHIPSGPTKDALAIRDYIDWARSRDEVEKVVVKVDSIVVFGTIAALVTVSVFTTDFDSVNLSMKIDFESLSDSLIMISDTTYLKEIQSAKD